MVEVVAEAPPEMFQPAPARPESRRQASAKARSGAGSESDDPGS